MNIINVFGGTFSPPHLAHTQIIQRINKSIQPDINYIVPAIAWQKSCIIPAHYRFEMCEAAFCGLDNTYISDIEISQNKPSYTVETLEKIKNIHPQSQIYLTIGLDQLINIHTWHRWQELQNYANFYVINRTSIAQSHNLKNKQDISMLENVRKLGNVIIDEWQPPYISSTQIREQIMHDNWDNLEKYLDMKVINYIKQHKLYTELENKY